MSGKTILDTNSPATQRREAVKSLIAFYNHGQAPEEMPAFFRLYGEIVLVQSNKGDSYYVATPQACSCPSATYRPNQPCKHRRAYFPAPKAKAKPMPEKNLLQEMEEAGYAMSFTPGDEEEESLMSGQPFKPFLESDRGMEVV